MQKVLHFALLNRKNPGFGARVSTSFRQRAELPGVKMPTEGSVNSASTVLRTCHLFWGRGGRAGAGERRPGACKKQTNSAKIHRKRYKGVFGRKNLLLGILNKFPLPPSDYPPSTWNY